MRVLSKQTGETIIEVLISMAVLGLVLSASYALANRSTQANRQAQERAEALSENSTRIELLKTYLEDDGSVPAGDFCVYRNSSGELKTQTTTGTIPSDAQEYDPADYPNQCKAGPGGRYGTAINKSGDTYIVTTRWFRVAEGGVEELSIEYKTYKASELSYDPDADSAPTDIELPPPACDDTTDNDGDGKIDLADPGCDNADDTTESPDPLTNFAFNGADYSSCVSNVVCYKSGTRVFSCWEYRADYSVADKPNVAAGAYFLTIQYSNGSDNHCDDPWAQPGYEYFIRIYVDGEVRATPHLSSPYQYNSKTSNPINIGDLEPDSVIRIRWVNDSNPSGPPYDANFQINKLKLTKN